MSTVSEGKKKILLERLDKWADAATIRRGRDLSHMLEWQLPFGEFRNTWSYEQLAATEWGRRYLKELADRLTPDEIIDDWVFEQNRKADLAGKPWPYVRKRTKSGDPRGWVLRGRGPEKRGRRVTLSDVPDRRPYVTPSIRTAANVALAHQGSLEAVAAARGVIEDPSKAFRSGYVYHVTPYRNLKEIKKRGLVQPRRHLDRQLLERLYEAGRRGTYWTTYAPDPGWLPSRNRTYRTRYHPLEQLKDILDEIRHPARGRTREELIEGYGSVREFRRQQIERARRIVAQLDRHGGEQGHLRGLAALRTKAGPVMHRMKTGDLLQAAGAEGSSRITAGAVTTTGRVGPKRLELLRTAGGKLKWGALLPLLALMLVGEKANEQA